MKTPEIKNKYIVISLSGGMDSSSLLLHCLANNFQVRALSFDYKQKHKIELNRVRLLKRYLGRFRLRFSHDFINLRDFDKIIRSNLMQGNPEVPTGHYAEDNMKQTVVPNRNKIFSSIIQATALSIKNNANPQDEVYIGMGIHSGDHAIYPDTTQEFREADLKAFHVGNWDASDIDYYTPYLHGDKYTILKDGLESCEKLGLDFSEVYKRTFTSYKPIYNRGKNQWYSDFKTGSSVERILAFHKLGIPDPAGYADDDGKIVTWERVVEHALEVERKFKEKNPPK